MKKYLAIILVFTVFCATAKTRIGENINVTHYEIHINNLDFTNHTLDAVTIVTLTAKEAVNYFDLELKSLTVSDVTSNDATVSGFTQSGDVLTINLATALATNTSASFTITYSGNTFNDGWGGILWSGGYVCNMGVGFTEVPHNLGKAWFPCVDNFTDKATYDVFVTVPTELTAVCGGNLVIDTDNGDGTHTVHYNMPQEIATYHISFVAGDYVEWTDTYHGMNGDIPVNVYVKPSQINKVEGTFVNVKDIASFFENCFGPYPFNRIGYSITSVGCMEHVDNIGITSGVLTGNTSQEEYVAHEMSHMWFGNKITCATAEEMWLNEGFAQFCGLFYRSAIYGEDDFQSAMSNKITSIASWCTSEANWIPLSDIPQSMTYDSEAVYNRGAVVVNTMMNYLGRETFLAAMRDHLNNYAYSASSTEQLRDDITASTGVDMNGFFDTYVFTAGIPHYEVTIMNVTPSGNQYDVKVQMTYKHVGPEHVGENNRVEVTFISQEGQMQTQLVNWDGLQAEQNITLDINPVYAFVDYYNRFLDAKNDKNLTATAPATLSHTRNTIKVNAVTDSVMLRSEVHMAGPDNDPCIPGLTISTNHYWNIMRLDFGDADVSATFDYSSSADDDIIHSANDSAVLLYRVSALDDWHIIPYTVYGSSTWKLGRFILDDLQSGQYTIGAIDLSHYGIDELNGTSGKVMITPNPATNKIRIATDFDKCNVLIMNTSGQTVDRFSVKGKETEIDVSNYQSGVYHINILDENKKVISTEKLVKR